MYRYLAALTVVLLVCWNIKYEGAYLGVKIGFFTIIYLASFGLITIIDDLVEAVKKWRG